MIHSSMVRVEEDRVVVLLLVVRLVVVGGLAVFGLVFAINSSIHSYLILAYANQDQVAMDVGFYYMANASGRLVGTILSGIVFQFAGLTGCLWTSMLFLLVAAVLSKQLPTKSLATG